MKKSTIALGLLSTAACLFPSLGLAQTASAPATEAQATLTDEDEVVVTAGRRTQRFVDSPLTVTVATAQQLDEAGIQGTADLELVTPGFNVTLFGPYVQTTLRGVGTTALGPGADNNVAIYVDGVYQASQTAALFEFDGIDRIEVLKGPQGTLYGRNATGGAVVVSTREPSLAGNSFSAEASYGSFEEYGATGFANVVLSDTAALNVSIFNRANEGYTFNVTTNEPASQTESFGVRGRFLYEPTDYLRFILSATHIYTRDNTALSFAPFNRNSVNPASQGATFGATDHSRVALNRQPTGLIDYDALTLSTQLSGDWGTLLSITSYTESDTPFVGDQDGIEIDKLASYVPLNNQQTMTQEITYTSPEYEHFNWLAGFSYLRDETESAFQTCSADFLLIGQPQCITHAEIYRLTATDPDAFQSTDAIAFYAEGTYNITPDLHLTLGGRYSWEEKHATNRNGIGGELLMEGTDSWSSLTPNAALRYDLSDASSLFVSYSEGFKSGLFDVLTTAPCAGGASFTPVSNIAIDPACPSSGNRVNPETVQNYEIGYKYNAGGTSFSAAAFFSEYQDIQLNSRDGIGNLLLLNAAEAEIYGFETEISANLNSQWSVRGGFNYTHSEYTDFPNAQMFIPDPLFPGAPPNNNPNKRVIVDASGYQMVRAPEYTAFATIGFHQPVSFGAFDAALTASYNSGFPWDFIGRLQEDSYTVLNTQVRWTSPSERFHVTLFGDNITDQERMLYVRESNTGDLVSYSKPDSYGIRVGVDF